MSIKLELTFTSFEELRKFADHQVKQPGGDKDVDASPKKSSPPKVDKPVAEKPKEAPQEEITDTGEDGEDDIVAEPSFDDVKEAILKVNRLKGKPAAKAILAKFGAEKVGPEIKEKDYAAIIKECNAVAA